MAMAMATKTKSCIAANTAVTAHAKCCSGPEPAVGPVSSPSFPARLRRACGHGLRFAAAAAVGYSFASTAWRARHEPQDLAFVAASASLLAALFACLWRAELLAPAETTTPAGERERRRLQAAVWALSTALSCAFAYRVAAVIPPPLAVLVWGMTASVALVGLYLLVLCRDQPYQVLPGDGDDAAIASDRKLASSKISPTDELV